MGKYKLQALDLQGNVSMGTEPEQNNARVRLVLHKDERAKVAIVGDENALLAVGKLEDLMIGKAGRVVQYYRGDIMSLMLQIAEKPRIDAFIEEKSHPIEAAVLGARW